MTKPKQDKSWSNTSDIYQHYKGGLYTLLFQCQNATNANDRDEMVVYVSRQNGQIYCRLASEFFGSVMVEGIATPHSTISCLVEVKRFQQVQNK